MQRGNMQTIAIKAPEEATIRRFWACYALVASPVAGEAQAARIMASKIASTAGLTIDQFKTRYPDPNYTKRLPTVPVRPNPPKPAPAQPPAVNPFLNRMQEAKQRAAVIKACREQKKALEAMLQTLKEDRINMRHAIFQDEKAIASAKASIKRLNKQIRDREALNVARKRRISNSSNETIGIKNTITQIEDQLAKLSVKKAFNGLTEEFLKAFKNKS